MTNVITDAGTDAKIAKFFKRGLEIMGLAMLEPVEVYGRYRWSDSFDALDKDVTINIGIARTGSHMSHTSTSTSRPSTAPGGPTTNTTNYGGFGNNNGTHELEPVIEVPSPSTPKENATKKLFGGLFKKKKEPPSPLPIGLRGHRSSKSIGDGPPTASTPSALSSSFAPPSLPSTPRTPTMAPSALPPSGPGSGFGSGAEVILQPQILGLQAVLQAPVNPPKGRPTTYVWVIRKWIKGSHEGLLGAVADTLGLPGINMNMIMPGGSGGGSGSAQGSAISTYGGPGNPGPTECEVRFEWKRGNKVLKSAAAAANAASANAASANAAGANAAGANAANSGTSAKTSEEENTTRKPKNRFSIQTDPARRGSIQIDPARRGSGNVMDEQGAAGLLSVGAAGAASPASKRLSFQGFGKKTQQPTPQAQAQAQGSSENLRQANASLSPNKNPRSGSPNPPASLATSVNTDDNPHATRSRDHDHDPDADEESEEESDPEDSERPWNCYVHVRRAPIYRARGSRTSLAAASGASGMAAHPHPHPQPPSFIHGTHGTQGDDVEEGESLDIKLRVACLMPAPHHPKVVAQVKTPYPLPDIVFDRPTNLPTAQGSGFSKYTNIFSSNSNSTSAQDSASNTMSSKFSNASGHANSNGQLVDSNGHGNGHGNGNGNGHGNGNGNGNVDNLSARKPGARLRQRDPDASRADLDDPHGPNAPLVLTAEEIKDVVSCTGLWLVVREGYGGLAKKRKGDGWRLRG
jgi:hypothetical protein